MVSTVICLIMSSAVKPVSCTPYSFYDLGFGWVILNFLPDTVNVNRNSSTVACIIIAHISSKSCSFENTIFGFFARNNRAQTPGWVI